MKRPPVCHFLQFNEAISHLMTFTTALESLDLEGDWDPDSHDRQMADIYGQDDGDLPFDDEKPHWDDDIDIGDIVPPEALEDYDDEGGDGESKKKKKKKKKKSKEDEWDDGGVDIDEMDADLEGLREEEWDGSEEMRKQVLEKYLDEVYDLEFNDVVCLLSIYLTSTVCVNLIISRRRDRSLDCLPVSNMPKCSRMPSR